MRRHTRIAATVAIALSLLLASQAAPAKEYDDIAKDAYLHMTLAKNRCDPGAYAAHRTRLMGAIAAMRFFAQKAKKLKGWSDESPKELNQRADDYESLIDIWDMRPWRCPSKAKGDGQTYLPSPKADPPDWAIALAGQQAGPIHDGFDGPGAGSFDGIAMVDRAMRAAHGGMGDGRGPDCTEAGETTGRRSDSRFPGGFAPFMPAGPGPRGFGGWGW